MSEDQAKFSRADQLTLQLQSHCAKLCEGDKFMSVRQIMRDFAVSQNTVQQSLERLCRAGVLEVKDRSGYIVRRRRTYGKIVTFLPEQIHEYVHELERHLNHYAGEAGFEHEMVYYSDENATIQGMTTLQADAVIFSPLYQIGAPAINHLMALPFPVVLIRCSPRIENCRYANNDNEMCGFLAAMQLMNLGHKKLAVFISEPDISNIRELADGFCKFADVYRLPVEILNPQVTPGEYSPEKSRIYWEKYLAEHPKLDFTGLFVTSAKPAFEIIAASARHGIKVPDDLSVIGITHTGYPEGNIDLSSIHGRRGEMIRCAVQIIKDHFDHVIDAPKYYDIAPEVHCGCTVKSIS